MPPRRRRTICFGFKVLVSLSSDLLLLPLSFVFEEGLRLMCVSVSSASSIGAPLNRSMRARTTNMTIYFNKGYSCSKAAQSVPAKVVGKVAQIKVSRLNISFLGSLLLCPFTLSRSFKFNSQKAFYQYGSKSYRVGHSLGQAFYFLLQSARADRVFRSRLGPSFNTRQSFVGITDEVGEHCSRIAEVLAKETNLVTI